METDPLHSTSQPKSKRPKDTPFRQQQLKSKRPYPTALSAIVIFAVIGSAFICLGALLLNYSADIIQVKERYDNVADCDNTKWDTRTACEVEIKIEDDMEGPVYFYYYLTSYYQNQRRYVKSRSKEQLKGKDLTETGLAECEPVITMDKLGRLKQDLQGAVDLEDDDVANPCGLVAKSFFNDTFTLYSPQGTEVTIDTEDIAWQEDIDRGFNHMHSNWTEAQWTDVENGIAYLEHFIVWSRLSGLPNFKKLWGVIDDDLDAGTYKLIVNSCDVNTAYPTTDWDGTKAVLLSTTNGFGGDNTILGSLYLAFGSVSYLLSSLFCVKSFIKRRRRVGSTKYKE
jgi:hypothetical protein